MKKKKNKINIIIFFMFALSLYLGFKINEIKQFVILPEINVWLPFETLFNKTDQYVSKDVEYYHLIDDLYTNGSTSCISIFDGIVMEVNDTSISILSDNGILVTYGQIDHMFVQVDERILKGSAIGMFEDSLSLKFSKDNQELSYEEAMKS